MNKITKIIVCALLGAGCGIQAITPNAVLKQVKNWGPAAISLGLMGAAVHNAVSRDGKTLLTKDMNCGAMESFLAGGAYALFSGLKYMPRVGKHLDNNVGNIALLLFFANNVCNSVSLAVSCRKGLQGVLRSIWGNGFNTRSSAEDSLNESYENLISTRTDEVLKEEFDRAYAFVKNLVGCSAVYYSLRYLLKN